MVLWPLHVDPARRGQGVGAALGLTGLDEALFDPAGEGAGEVALFFAGEVGGKAWSRPVVCSRELWVVGAAD